MFQYLIHDVFLCCISGHYIGEIDKGSPAERAGLKNGDRLVAVNGEEINNCTHEQVVNKIGKEGNKCCLLVLDAETEKIYKLVSHFQSITLLQYRNNLNAQCLVTAYLNLY